MLRTAPVDGERDGLLLHAESGRLHLILGQREIRLPPRPIGAELVVDADAEHTVVRSGAAPPSTETLERVFGELEAVRIPFTAQMVKKARAQGETRVVSGTQACLERNKNYRAMLADEKLIKQRFGA